jgi:hypothetical protein
MPTFKDFGLDATTAQQGSRAFAEFLAFVTNHNDRLAGQARRPVLYIEMRSAHRAGYQPRISREILIGSNVDKSRRVSRSNKPR